MSAARPALRALADRLGILPGYRDVEGRERPTRDATREALLAAMGLDASGEAAALDALEALDRSAAEQILEPVLVWREWAGGPPRARLTPPPGCAGRDYRLELTLEDGKTRCAAGRLGPPDAAGGVDLELPCAPEPGYHALGLEIEAPGGPRRASQRLVVCPRRAVQPEALLGEGRAFGLWANLYALRSRGDWGHGGLAELVRLGRFAGEAGAAFVGINPLHAVTNRGLDFAPYSPSSRLYRNVLYLDPEAVPELARCVEARALLDEPRLRQRRRELRAAPRIDHEAVLDAVLPLLRALHAGFGSEASAERRAAYAAYLEREGDGLRDFATWEVLAERQGGPGAGPERRWWRWPEALRDARGAAVERFRREHAADVDFRCWLQFELDRQLGAAADAVRAAGCPLGLYQDLALGSSRASADTWMAPGLYARGVQVGAPPDAYAPAGQGWGFPPFDPRRLREAAYRPWSRLLGAALAHAGALRLDHAMGLLRLFWIPEGGGEDGAYVAYRADELLGVLALESQRHRAVVVAEDLGTLPPELPGLLEDWGLLRSAVLQFARDDGAFRPSERYPPRALATLGTHDLPPLAGYVDGRDLALRRRVEAIDSAPALEAARAERRAERAALLAALRAESLLGEAEPDARELCDAVHAFLAATPSVLVGVSLDDLAGETEPVNVPGVPLERHRSWSRRMARPLEELLAGPELRARLEPLRGRSRRLPARG